MRVVIGDGRLGLMGAPDAAYGLIVLDAFSSDAIPAHLLTEEAIAGYRRKLAPGGVLAVHITNRHLDLAPVLAAEADRLGLVAVRRQQIGSGDLTATSDWVVLARDSGESRTAPRRRWMDRADPAEGRARVDRRLLVAGAGARRRLAVTGPRSSPQVASPP